MATLAQLQLLSDAYNVPLAQLQANPALVNQYIAKSQGTQLGVMLGTTANPQNQADGWIPTAVRTSDMAQPATPVNAYTPPLPLPSTSAAKNALTNPAPSATQNYFQQLAAGQVGKAIDPTTQATFDAERMKTVGSPSGGSAQGYPLANAPAYSGQPVNAFIGSVGGGSGFNAAPALANPQLPPISTSTLTNTAGAAPSPGGSLYDHIADTVTTGLKAWGGVNDAIASNPVASAAASALLPGDPNRGPSMPGQPSIPSSSNAANPNYAVPGTPTAAALAAAVAGGAAGYALPQSPYVGPVTPDTSGQLNSQTGYPTTSNNGIVPPVLAPQGPTPSGAPLGQFSPNTPLDTPAVAQIPNTTNGPSQVTGVNTSQGSVAGGGFDTGGGGGAAPMNDATAAATTAGASALASGAHNNGETSDDGKSIWQNGAWVPLLGGALGAAGSIGGAVIMSEADKAAAAAQQQGTQAAIEAQNAGLDKILAAQKEQFTQQQTNAQPWIDTGKGALNDLWNKNGNGLIQTYSPPTYDNFKFDQSGANADPSYSFRLSEGLKALENSAAARGGLLSGNTGKALENYGQNAASQEYQNAFQRYNTEYQNKFNNYQTQYGTGLNALQSVAGLGQTAVGQANNASQNYANNATQAYGNQTSGVSNALMSGANAAAGGMTGSANALASGMVGASNSLTSLLNGYYQNQQSQQMVNALMRSK